ncbi:DUF1566 domain-containing protein [Sulfurovum lithotrophicum]|uniref:Lcl C-terminal domain-containing protein n=1 Tax=Sulfurovum lithotrophicum TaxID=206403 RepID=UPI0006967733|nr:DUF1566 domain-containing protein [Sulfurovum lithotrophicum]
MQKMKTLFIAMLVGVGGFVHAQGMADVVLDKKNGIYWQDNVDSQQSSEDWDDAMAYCDKLVLDGMAHWRLPSFRELLSIVDYRRMDPAVNAAFEFVEEGTYWTSTTFAPNVSRAWTIDFRTGKTYYSYKSTNHAVRCVKDVPAIFQKESK